MKRNNATMERKKISGEDGGNGGATASAGEKTVVKPNVNQGGINDEIPSNLIETVGEITPNLLHGGWIKVERKK